MEVDVTFNPLLGVLGDIRPDGEGCVQIPDAPGLGFELDVERLEEWTSFHWTLHD